MSRPGFEPRPPAGERSSYFELISSYLEHQHELVAWLPLGRVLHEHT
jgi:hypothetical protein